MLLREKGKAGSDPVSMGWDEAQAALQTGNYEVASEAPQGGPAGATEADVASPTPVVVSEPARKTRGDA